MTKSRFTFADVELLEAGGHRRSVQKMKFSVGYVPDEGVTIAISNDNNDKNVLVTVIGKFLYIIYII